MDSSTDTSYENQTEATVEEIVQPARLVSLSSIESSPHTTSFSTATRFSYSEPIITTARSITVAQPSQNISNAQPIRRFYPSPTMPSWRLRQFSDMQQSQSSPHHQTEFQSSPKPTAMIMLRDKWRNKSGCYYSCIQQAQGLQTVVSKYDFSTSVQLCQPTAAVSPQQN